MNSLLVFIHVLDEAEHMIRYAAEAGKDLNLDVDLLYTVEMGNYPLGIPGAARPTFQYTYEQVESLLEEARSKLETEIKKIQKTVENPPLIKAITKQGISHHLVDDFTQKDKYHYVMVAAHSDNEFLINDRNIDIIKHVKIPVWIVPEKSKYKPARSIVYATDYKEADIETMKKLTVLAKKNDAGITALHVNDNLDFEEKVRNSGFKDMLADKLGYSNIDVTTLKHPEDKSLAQTINEFAKDIHADLIVALKENKGFFERLFSKSQTKKLISTSKLPVLVFPELK